MVYLSLVFYTRHLFSFQRLCRLCAFSFHFVILDLVRMIDIRYSFLATVQPILWFYILSAICYRLKPVFVVSLLPYSIIIIIDCIQFLLFKLCAVSAIGVLHCSKWMYRLLFHVFLMFWWIHPTPSHLTLSHATPPKSTLSFRSFVFLQFLYQLSFHFIFGTQCCFSVNASAISHISISKRDKELSQKYNVKIWKHRCKSHCDLLHSFLDSILAFHCLSVQSQCFEWFSTVHWNNQSYCSTVFHSQDWISRKVTKT